MTARLPAEIAEAIEAYGKAAYAQGYFGDSAHEGAGLEVKVNRAALDAVILKHIRGEWRPMSEAPQKGRLLAIVGDEVRVIAYGKTSHVPIYGWCLADQGVEDFDLCTPAGWMPMPSTDLGREENHGRGQ